MTPDTNKERARPKIDANDLEAMAKARPDECFLKGSGILKLTSAIRKLEREARAAKAPAAPTQAEFALRALVAAGFVTQAKVDEAMTLPGTPPAAEPVAEVKELFIPATGATAKAAHLMDTSLPGGTMLYTAPPAPTEQWVPIETAPEDGSRLILTDGAKVFRGGFAKVGFKEHRDADGNYIDQTDPDAYWLNFEDGDVCHPTHWQPEPALPAPPHGAAKGATA